MGRGERRSTLIHHCNVFRQVEKVCTEGKKGMVECFIDVRRLCLVADIILSSTRWSFFLSFFLGVVKFQLNR